MTKTQLAEKMAEFLGISKSKSILKDWLTTAEAERAILDKLLAEKFLIFFEESRERPPLIECELERDGTRGPKVIIIETEASTRIEALINAVLEMLKEDRQI